MPLKKCTRNKRPGWKWGDEGHCYDYEPNNAASEATAKHMAIKQGYTFDKDKIKYGRKGKK